MELILLTEQNINFLSFILAGGEKKTNMGGVATICLLKGLLLNMNGPINNDHFVLFKKETRNAHY